MTWSSCIAQPEEQVRVLPSCSLTTRSRMRPSWSTWTTCYLLVKFLICFLETKWTRSFKSWSESWRRSFRDGRPPMKTCSTITWTGWRIICMLLFASLRFVLWYLFLFFSIVLLKHLYFKKCFHNLFISSEFLYFLFRYICTYC